MSTPHRFTGKETLHSAGLLCELSVALSEESLPKRFSRFKEIKCLKSITILAPANDRQPPGLVGSGG